MEPIIIMMGENPVTGPDPSQYAANWERIVRDLEAQGMLIEPRGVAWTQEALDTVWPGMYQSWEGYRWLEEEARLQAEQARERSLLVSIPASEDRKVGLPLRCRHLSRRHKRGDVRGLRVRRYDGVILAEGDPAAVVRQRRHDADERPIVYFLDGMALDIAQ